MAHKHQDGNRSTTSDVEVLWSALSITMSEYGHFAQSITQLCFQIDSQTTPDYLFLN